MFFFGRKLAKNGKNLSLVKNREIWTSVKNIGQIRIWDKMDNIYFLS